MTESESPGRTKQLALFGFLILLGPINFGGELVTLDGYVAWRQIFAGIVGTILWYLLARTVISYVI